MFERFFKPDNNSSENKLHERENEFPESDQAICEKNAARIKNTLGMEIDIKGLTIGEKSVNDLSQPQRDQKLMDSTAFYEYGSNAITIVGERLRQSEAYFNKIGPAAMIDKKNAAKLPREYTLLHEEIHAAHYQRNPEVFEKIDFDLREIKNIISLADNNYRNCTELQAELKTEVLARKIDFSVNVSKLPDDIRQKAEEIKRLMAENEELQTRTNELQDHVLNGYLFREIIAHAGAAEIAKKDQIVKSFNPYDVFFGMVKRNLNGEGIKDKLLRTIIDSMLLKNKTKDEYDSYQLTLEGMIFFDNIQKASGGDFKKTFDLILNNPPQEMAEIKDPSLYLKRMK